MTMTMAMTNTKAKASASASANLNDDGSSKIADSLTKFITISVVDLRVFVPLWQKRQYNLESNHINPRESAKINVICGKSNHNE